MALTDTEAEQLALLMGKVEFPAPKEVFFAWLGNFYGNSTELAFLNTKEGLRRLLLVQRPPNDPYYPNEWHMPGGVVLPRRTFEQTIESCVKREVGEALVYVAARARYRAHWDNTDAPRGHENQFLYSIELSPREAAVAKEGKFFPFDRLPSPICSPHVKLIEYLRNNL